MIKLVTLLDLIGVFSFSVSGTVFAIKTGLDIFGIYTISFITAMGGGVLRDVIMQRGVPVLFTSYTAIFIIIFTTTFIILIKGQVKYSKLFFFFDSLGLAVFSINTASFSVQYGYNIPSIIFMSIITAVGGGVIRDMLCNKVPYIFVEDIYATASLMGVGLFILLSSIINELISVYISIIFIIIIRIVSKLYNLHLPKFNNERENINE